MTNIIEFWKPIPSFEGFYEASTLGRIRSVDKLVNCKNNSKKLVKGRLLNPDVCRGYLRVCISNGNKHFTPKVHQLIAKTFIPNPNNKNTVNHINGIKLDNRLENLEWATYSENNKHAYSVGLKNSSGSKNPNCKLKIEDVIDIRNSKTTLKEAAKKYNVNINTISGIRTKRLWKNLT